MVRIGLAVALCGEKGIMPRGRKEHGGKIRGRDKGGKSMTKKAPYCTVLVPVLVPGTHHYCPHQASGFYGCCSELQSQIDYLDRKPTLTIPIQYE